jgi:hypothetical protein
VCIFLTVFVSRVFSVRIGPADLLGGALARRLPSALADYSDEAIRAICRAEQQTIGVTRTVLNEQFDAAE